ncbi:MAG: selenocysteine-specific translation elongation factor, partial [Planctomycetaceae bacterium]|nr:selenocysteine-specific translation elongation factor [Planctomycetaceae bacterium]
VIGHIDHGKTSLVAALTGIDTDTHPEEKRRGITIDLGFASCDCGPHRFAFIDAPGHQKYIGNLLAGVAAVDIGLLVVACDQGIQQQTLEHAAILQMLGVRRLVAVVSRIDLSTEKRFAELQEELEIFLEDYGFQDIPVIGVCSPSGTGLDQLKAVLSETAGQIRRPGHGPWFRMPIDRVLNMPGRGCVVAGTIWSGTVNVGDTLVLADSGTTVRVREIEVHGAPADTSTAGFRTALNITATTLPEIERGDELVAPDIHPQGYLMAAELRALKSSPELRLPAVMQCHSATKSCVVRLTGDRQLLPGHSQIVVLESEQPLVAWYGQHFLLRLPYPVGTVGGGRVLAVLPAGTRKGHRLTEFGCQLVEGDAADRLAAWTEFQGETDPRPPWLQLQLGIAAEESAEVIERAKASGRILSVKGTSRLASVVLEEQVRSRATMLLQKQAENVGNAWLAEPSLVSQLTGRASAELVRSVINSLVSGGGVVRLNSMLAVASDDNSLSKKQQARLSELVQLFDGNRSPPNLKELSAALQIAPDTATSLSRFAIQTGILTDIGNGLLISSSVFEILCAELQQLFAEKPELTAAEIKDRWNVTRKHAIPLLEYCDKLGLTIRNDAVRTIGPALKANPAL